MKTQKLLIRILCILLSSLIVLSFIVMAIPARGVNQTDIELIQEKRQQLEKQLEEQAEVVRSLEANTTLIIERKSALDRQIELNRENILLMEEELGVYDRMIEEKDGELTLARTAEEDQASIFRARVRSMEEKGNYSYLSFLFDADSIPELLSRIGDVKDVMHYDQKLEEDLQQARSQLEEIKRDYEQIQLERSRVQEELSEKKQLLDAQVEAACRLISDLESQTDGAQKEYAAIEAAEREAYAQEQKAVAEYAAQLYAAQMAQRNAAAAAAAAAASAPVPALVSAENTGSDGGPANVSSDGFIWPVDSTYITSRYGPRVAPTAGASTYHKAVDISAAAGSPIYAVADGQVAVATRNDGLGIYVSVVHPDGTTTRYSHMSSMNVSAGQTVTQGQVIGYVGATGIATGNHLDFAVIQDGQQIDPLQFYDSSSLTFDPTA